jgi:phage gpG-like protein
MASLPETRSAALEIQGLPELRKALRQLEPNIRKEFRRETFRRASEFVAKEARPDLPVRSGRLQASLRGTTGGDKAIIRSSLPYSNFIYWGGSVGRGHVPGKRGYWKGAVKLERREFVINGQVVKAAHPAVHLAMARDRQKVIDIFADGVERSAQANGWKVTRK